MRRKAAGACRDAVTVFAVVNQKGGVGKTTTVVNLGAYLGAAGYRVLLIDADPQSNTTSSLGYRPTSGGLYDVLTRDVYPPLATISTAAANLDLLPSTEDLSAAEMELLDLDEPERRLWDALSAVRTDYPFIFIDCPPSLGLLTLNALVAADVVLVPVQCDYLALEGLARLMNTLERVRVRSNPRLRIFGLLLTMYDGRTTLSQQVASEVRRHYPRLTFDTMIPRSVRLSEAPSFGRTILDYDALSRGGEAYGALAREVVARVQQFENADKS